MLNKELLEVLACPKCKEPITYNNKENKIICNRCKHIFNILDNIPDMLIERD